jgi:hypothetical protein
MDMQEFARDIVQAANTGGQITILPISQKDRALKCVIRFRLGTLL